MNNYRFKIFDAHIHTFGTFMDKNEDLISYMDNCNVEKAILTTINRAVSSKIYSQASKEFKENHGDLDDFSVAFEKMKRSIPTDQLDHQDVIDIAAKAPTRFYKFFWFNPKIQDKEKNYKILENHFYEGFCGVKIHSGIHLIEIPRDILTLIEFMQDYNKNFPLFIHYTPKFTAFGGISSTNIAKIASSYPELKIIIGHAALAMELAVDLSLSLRKYSNIFFETSCSIPYGILTLIRNIGHKRVIFGSDSPVTNPLKLEIDKILSLPINDEIKQDIFYNNVLALFED
ncbi:MAG: amidohydrolase family protein [Candidatus Hodarchaeota archaeon]